MKGQPTNKTTKKNKKSFKKVLTLFKIYAIIKYRKNKKNERVDTKSTKVVKLEKLNELAVSLKEKKLTVNGVKIKQTERNQVKSDVLDALASDLTSGGVEVVGRTQKGIVIAIENDTEGALYGVIDYVVKDLDYDPQIDLDIYAEKVEARLERERKKAEKKA